MKYHVIIKSTDGTETKAVVTACNSKQAHENARTLASDESDVIRVYALLTDSNGQINTYALYRAAIQIATVSAQKAMYNGGTDTQRTIYNSLSVCNYKAGLHDENVAGMDYLIELIARMDHDAQEYVAYAYEGLLQGLSDNVSIEECYHKAYIYINKYIMTQRSASIREISTEYITDNDGEIVAINAYIARIINGGDRYIPCDSGIMDSEMADRLGAVLNKAFNTLFDSQKRVVKYLACGYSQRATAEKLHFSNVARVNEMLVNIRKKVLEYIQENATEFLPLIDEISVKTAKTDRHKNNAERMREYRKRKKTEKSIN